MDYDVSYKAKKTKQSKTLVECSNEMVTPEGRKGPVVAKVPVVISEPVVQIDVEAKISLDDDAFEIKKIKKNLFVTQCKLIDIDGDYGKLFLGGFVRKNIEYATADYTCDENKTISGEIKHKTVNIPFRCVTKVYYVVPPEMCDKGYAKEYAMYSDSVAGDSYCDQKIIGRHPCEQNFKHFECFNEKVYCELEDVKIFEDDIHKNTKPLGCKFPHEQIFDGLIEKMVILVKLKLLQKQQVHVPGYDYYYKKKHR